MSLFLLVVHGPCVCLFLFVLVLLCFGLIGKAVMHPLLVLINHLSQGRRETVEGVEWGLVDIMFICGRIRKKWRMNPLRR